MAGGSSARTPACFGSRLRIVGDEHHYGKLKAANKGIFQHSSRQSLSEAAFGL